mmetsp:Transcript_4956/g.17947  ORF Transcript_4956/g.17947 Transcript_4956/m.17947 type:complete len:192 (+) Transcript_4956:90-665(+)
MVSAAIHTLALARTPAAHLHNHRQRRSRAAQKVSSLHPQGSVLLTPGPLLGHSSLCLRVQRPRRFCGECCRVVRVSASEAKFAEGDKVRVTKSIIMYHLGKSEVDLNGMEGTVVKVLGEVNGVKVGRTFVTECAAMPPEVGCRLLVLSVYEGVGCCGAQISATMPYKVQFVGEGLPKKAFAHLSEDELESA